MNARSGKNKSRAAALKHKLGTGAGKYKLRTGIYKLRARGQGQARGSGNKYLIYYP